MRSLVPDNMKVSKRRDESGRKLTMVRDYSGGSLIARVRKIESMEELVQARDEILAKHEEGAFNAKTRRKLERVVNARHAELSVRLIQTPPSGRLFIPKTLAAGKLVETTLPAGGGLLGPDGKAIQ